MIIIMMNTIIYDNYYDDHNIVREGGRETDRHRERERERESHDDELVEASVWVWSVWLPSNAR